MTENEEKGKHPGKHCDSQCYHQKRKANPLISTAKSIGKLNAKTFDGNNAPEWVLEVLMFSIVTEALKSGVWARLAKVHGWSGVVTTFKNM